MAKRQVVVTGSRLEALYACQSKHFLKWVMERDASGGNNAAAMVGTVAHARWAEALGTITKELPLGKAMWEDPERWQLKKGLEIAARAAGCIVPTKYYTEAGHLSDWFARFWREGLPTMRWEEFAKIEEEFSFVAGEIVSKRGEIVEVVVKGIFDSLIRTDGAWFHGQLKTRGGYKPFPDFAWKIRRSWHELLYWEGAMRMGGHWDFKPWGGTILVAVDKIPMLARPEKKGEEPRLRGLSEGFHVDMLSISDWERYRVLQEVLQAAELIVAQEDLKETWDPKGEPFTAPVAQTGRGHECLKYDSVRCGFQHVCDGYLSITDPFTFKDSDGMERYEGGEESA